MHLSSASIVSTYNDLSDVVIADQGLLAMGRKDVIDSLLAVIRSHHLEDSVGLRLLHKHNELAQFEVMLEEAQIDRDGFALVTRATTLALPTDDVAPNSWLLCDDGFVPFEFSRVSLLRDSSVAPATYPTFFSELAAKLRETGLTRLVGPALSPSELVESQRPHGADVMLELTAIDERANVLRYAKASELSIGSPIETFWAATNPEKPNSSTPAEPDKIKTQRVCTRICPSVQNPPVHQGTYVHRQD